MRFNISEEREYVIMKGEKKHVCIYEGVRTWTTRESL